MSKATDVRVAGVRLYFLPVQMRTPLKFGKETVTAVTCARVMARVVDSQGRAAEGWGETPLSVQWVWPSSLPCEQRLERLKQFTVRLAEAWAKFEGSGHALEVGHDFQEAVLPGLLAEANALAGGEPMPWLAALVCCSAFDLAIHDAFGQLHQRPVYETYGPEFLNRDLGSYLVPAVSQVGFSGRYPCDFLRPRRFEQLRAWHLVGGVDVLEAPELTGREPNDGYPVLLADWIQRDGLKCLKVKLRGNDTAWDYDRLRLSPDLIELRNITLVGSLIVACAQRRRESRGLHYNLDHLRRSAAFGRRVMRLRRPAAGGAPLVPGSPGDL